MMKRWDYGGVIFRGIILGLVLVAYVRVFEKDLTHQPGHLLILCSAGLAVITDACTRWIWKQIRKKWPLEPPTNDNPVY